MIVEKVGRKTIYRPDPDHRAPDRKKAEPEKDYAWDDKHKKKPTKPAKPEESKDANTTDQEVEEWR